MILWKAEATNFACLLTDGNGSVPTFKDRMVFSQIDFGGSQCADTGKNTIVEILLLLLLLLCIHIVMNDVTESDCTNPSLET